MKRPPLSASVRTKLAKAKEAELRGQFVAMCRRFNLPTPMLEFRFCERHWKMDYAWPETMVCLESDGGLFVRGAHNRGARILLTHEKLNRAAVLGWRVLYTTPDRLCNYATIRVVAESMGMTLPALGAIR